MRACDQFAFVRGRFEYRLARGRSLLLVDVEFDGDLGLGELAVGVVHQVAPEQQALAANSQLECGVAGRVALGLDGREAGHDLVAPGEALSLAGGDQLLRRRAPS